MQTAAVRLVVRPMSVRDIPQVMEIEREAFPTMWPRTSFQRELQQNHLARYLVATRLKEKEDAPRLPPEFAALAGDSQPGGLAGLIDGLRQMVGGEGEDAMLPEPEKRDELVIGFVGNWLMVGESHIVSIAVREEHRGQRIGEMLVIAAIGVAIENGFAKTSLECRVSNAIALALYEKYGFRQVGVRPRYYSDNQEDAYIMLLENMDTPEFQQILLRLQQEHQRRTGEYEMYL